MKARRFIIRYSKNFALLYYFNSGTLFVADIGIDKVNFKLRESRYSTLEDIPTNGKVGSTREILQKFLAKNGLQDIH